MSSSPIDIHQAAANQPVFNEVGLMDARIPEESSLQRSMLRDPGHSFAQWLQSLSPEFGIFRVFQYLTFRAVMAALTASIKS